jgi:hypothetical protein
MKRYISEKERLKKQNIIVLDFTDSFYEDSFYRNADHLNEKGALRFTDEIIQILTALMNN